MLLETLFVALWANAVWLLDALAGLWFDGQLCLLFSLVFFGIYSDVACFFSFSLLFPIFSPFSHPLGFIILFSISWDFVMLTFLFSSLVSNMLNKLSGQPESYEKKYAPTLFSA